MIEEWVKEGIINAEDINALQSIGVENNRRILFVDATFVLPTSNEDTYQNFLNTRLPNARFFDIKSIKDTSSPLPHMLPTHNAFAAAMSSMGIRNDDIIVTYGQHDMIMGPARAWWMLRGFGHNDVLVLNGGLPAWQELGLDTHTGQPAPIPTAQYQAQSFKKDMLSTLSDVRNASNNKTCHILDARPSARFDGTTPEPRSGMRSGHIPNSMNAPAKSLVDEGGLLKSKSELTQIIENTGIDITRHDQRIITSCGSGITACALTLALHHIGYYNISVYDGSWSEWGLETSVTKV